MINNCKNLRTSLPFLYLTLQGSENQNGLHKNTGYVPTRAYFVLFTDKSNRGTFENRKARSNWDEAAEGTKGIVSRPDAPSLKGTQEQTES